MTAQQNKTEAGRFGHNRSILHDRLKDEQMPEPVSRCDKAEHGFAKNRHTATERRSRDQTGQVVVTAEYKADHDLQRLSLMEIRDSPAKATYRCCRAVPLTDHNRSGDDQRAHGAKLTAARHGIVHYPARTDV